METIDRRRMVGGILCGALAVAGFALTPARLRLKSSSARHPTTGITPTIGGAPSRRWVCWWHRGRRVCGWR